MLKKNIKRQHYPNQYDNYVEKMILPFLISKAIVFH